MFEKNFYQELFYSLNRKGSFRLSLDGFIIDLEKNASHACLTLSTLLFQKDFLIPAIRTLSEQTQKKRALSPYLAIDEKELKIFLMQKVPLFLPSQLEILVPRFLFFAKRWCSLIQEIS